MKFILFLFVSGLFFGNFAFADGAGFGCNANWTFCVGTQAYYENQGYYVVSFQKNNSPIVNLLLADEDTYLLQVQNGNQLMLGFSEDDPENNVAIGTIGNTVYNSQTETYYSELALDSGVSISAQIEDQGTDQTCSSDGHVTIEHYLPFVYDVYTNGTKQNSLYVPHNEETQTNKTCKPTPPCHHMGC